MSAAWLPLFVAGLGPAKQDKWRGYYRPGEAPTEVVYGCRRGKERLCMKLYFDQEKDAEPFVERGAVVMLPYKYRQRSYATGEWYPWEEIEPNRYIVQALIADGRILGMYNGLPDVPQTCEPPAPITPV